MWGEPLTSCAGADQLTSCNGQNIRYDASGNPTTYRGYTMTWQGRRLMSATNGTNTVAYAYDENGIRTQKTANETATSYRYHGSVLISQVTGNDKLLFSYDANGNITHIQQGTNHVYYQYDSLNQLTREDNSLLNQSIVYTYDNRGNLLTKQEYAYVADGGTLEEPTDTITYGYDSANQQWADQLTSYDGEDIRYDANGNPTTYRGYTMAWQGRRLTSATNGTNTVSYAYDENGIRTQKTVNGTATQYRYHGSVLISQVTGSNKLLFSYDANGNVVAVNYNGTYYYYVRNGQGDIVRLIDGSNNTVVEYAYDSWGKQLSCTGSLASTLGTQNPFRYRGYIYDPETALYYLQTRYYDPETARFINADIYVSTGQGVLGHNMYAYCMNNPANMLDSEGTVGLALFIGGLIATAVGAVVGGMRSAAEGGSFWEGAASGAITAACTAAAIAVSILVLPASLPAAGVLATTLAGGAGGAVGAAIGYEAELAVNKLLVDKSKNENSNKPIIERTRSDIEAHKRVKAGLRGGMMAGGLGAGGTFLPGDPLSTGVYSYFTGFLAEAVNTLF